jgi:hypothetical protein
MKRRKWTKEEENKLKQLYNEEIPVKEIAETLGRTGSAIRNKAYKMGITNPKNFTSEEIEYIKENYKSYNLREIAKKIGREDNYHNVCRKARELGLERTGKKKEKVKVRKPKYQNEEERRKAQSAFAKEWHRNNEHPRGMLGKTHTLEYRKELSKRVKQDWGNRTPEEIEEIVTKRNKTRIRNKTLTPIVNKTSPYSRAKGGKRKDLNNMYFRSSWEANIARLLNYMGIEWDYEPKQFIFKGVYKQPISYTPDFYLVNKDKWVEVKGWMDKKSKLKLERFEQYYPHEYDKLILIDEEKYKKLEEEYSNIIKGWE